MLNFLGVPILKVSKEIYAVQILLGVLASTVCLSLVYLDSARAKDDINSGIPDDIPSVEIIIKDNPDVNELIIHEFVKDFELLGKSKWRLSPGFYSLGKNDRKLMFDIYASAYANYRNDEKSRKKLVKYSIGIPDVRENVFYIIDNNGDIRGDDPIDIVSKVQRARKNFPEVDKILTLEFLEEIETLQYNALAAIQQRNKKLSSQTQETQQRIEELRRRSEELEKDIKFLQELRDILFPS